jgi:hypothetical protein
MRLEKDKLTIERIAQAALVSTVRRGGARRSNARKHGRAYPHDGFPDLLLPTKSLCPLI